MVGLIYLKGDGVKVDVFEARKWFYRAAKNGLASAQNNMAFLWYGQQGHPVDLVKSYAWFVVAYQNGHPETDANYRAIIKKKLGKEQLNKAKLLISDLTE
jgi:TPR repeat protein